MTIKLISMFYCFDFNAAVLVVVAPYCLIYHSKLQSKVTHVAELTYSRSNSMILAVDLSDQHCI